MTFGWINQAEGGCSTDVLIDRVMESKTWDALNESDFRQGSYVHRTIKSNIRQGTPSLSPLSLEDFEVYWRTVVEARRHFSWPMNNSIQ